MTIYTKCMCYVFIHSLFSTIKLNPSPNFNLAWARDGSVCGMVFLVFLHTLTSVYLSTEFDHYVYKFF